MRLQSIIFPSLEGLDAKELYAKFNEKVQILNYNKARVDSGGVLDTGTYFNSISIRKWREYTKIKQIKLEGKIKGHYCLEVFERAFFKDNVQDQCIFSCEQNAEDEISLDVALTPQHLNSMCYVKIRSISDVEVEDLHYSGEETCDYSIKIAMIVCTYKREEFIKRNIDQIRKRILQNGEALLRKHLDIIVVDNGQTLNDGFEDILLIKNRNTGGTGGFTRGIIEALHQKEEKAYTHILLMDDDVDIEPEAFERMYSMLCLLKDNYRKSFIGGAMLRRDEPCVQEEAGAAWDGILHPQGKGYDLKKAENILKNDEIYPVDYNAWWYCCMPLSEIGLNNLPLPFFIHCDDMEYGLRNARNWILLNGICVWHEIAAVRKNIIRDYYDVRNFMVLNILYNKKGYSRWRLTKALIRRLAAGLIMPRLSFPMRVNAMKDFFRGVEWWEKQEIDILHQKVNSEKEKASVRDIINVCVTVLLFPVFYDKYHNNYHKYWRLLTTEKYWNKYETPPNV
ncbi:glycosyltransferase family 2 protein [Clostridium sp. Marseille-P2415]|uniref:glycosyltransferase family 2 protein n=1 Tax=Clostridium sp. Marseille-P2415 TaxID=1805471 RepID=UPI0009882FE5|nr:glycosyltransferase [Clostridium sp. Marseille-P2415]